MSSSAYNFTDLGKEIPKQLRLQSRLDRMAKRADILVDTVSNMDKTSSIDPAAFAPPFMVQFDRAVVVVTATNELMDELKKPFSALQTSILRNDFASSIIWQKSKVEKKTKLDENGVRAFGWKIEIQKQRNRILIWLKL